MSDVQEGLDYELAMLDYVAASGNPSAFLWQARLPALVLPDRFTRDANYGIAARASLERDWPVVARKTGGGITPQGPGVLNLALAFTVPAGQSRAILKSYAKIVDPMTAGFAQLGINAKATSVEGSFCDGDYNLAIGGRKIVGTAQRWRGANCLIHALVMTNIDIARAVHAVAALSADLKHDTVFDPDMHTRLADLMPPANDITQIAADAFWTAVRDAGYVPFKP